MSTKVSKREFQMDHNQKKTLLVVKNWIRKLYVSMPSALCLMIADFNKFVLSFHSKLIVGNDLKITNEGQKAERDKTETNHIVMFKESLPNFRITNCPFNNQMYRGYQIEITSTHITKSNLQMGITDICPDSSLENLRVHIFFASLLNR